MYERNSRISVVEGQIKMTGCAEPFAPFVRKSMCWIFTPAPHIPLYVQLIHGAFVFFHFGKEKGHL